METPWLKVVLIAAGLAAGLVGCGKKGPLYLPKEQPPGQKAPSGKQEKTSPEKQPAGQPPAGASHGSP
jgi:predicted small lipoprotein YifL